MKNNGRREINVIFHFHFLNYYFVDFYLSEWAVSLKSGEKIKT